MFQSRVLALPVVLLVAACAAPSGSDGASDAGADIAGSGGSGASPSGSSTGSASTGSGGSGAATANGTGATQGAGAAASTGGTTGEPTIQVAARGTKYCDDTTLWLGEMRAMTNEWTDPAADTCVWLNEDGTFGWNWTRGATGMAPNPTYPNYPEIEFGINPWAKVGDQSSTTLLPKKIKEITSASMTLDVNTVISGGNNSQGWNLAFEMWFTDADPTKGPAKVKGELMVFLANAPGYWPTEAKTNVIVSSNGKDYKLFESADDWGDWGYYRQYRLNTQDGAFNGKLDILPFLKRYVEQEGGNGEYFVTRFEIGDETFQNSGGTTTFKSLAFEVNGETRQALTTQP